MNSVLVKKIINTEYAVAPEDGVIVFEELKNLLDQNIDPIIVDFEGITRTTTAFFNSSLAIFLKDFSSEELNNHFQFKNLTSTSAYMLKRSIEMAKYRFSENLTSDDSLEKIIKEELKIEE